MSRKIIFDWSVIEKTRRPTWSRRRPAIIASAILVASVLVVMAFAIKQPTQDGQGASVQKASDPSSADKASTNQANTESSTIVHNGVTVVTPRLLVPVISADALDTTTADAGITSTNSAKTENHVARRSAKSRIVANRSVAPWFNPIRKQTARF